MKIKLEQQEDYRTYYEDKIGRRAIRFADFINKELLTEKILNILDYHNILLT